MSGSLRLHGYWRSSCSYRVRIALNHKGVGFEYVPVHLVKDGGQQYSEAYLSKNPMGEVPALEILDAAGETQAVLGQSVAILEYIEEQYPEPAMLPKDAFGRAKVRQLVEVVNSSIQPIQNLKVMRALGTHYDVEMAEAKKWGAYWIQRGFEGLEPIMAPVAGTYAFGDQVTLADAALIPQVYNANRFGIDLNQFPTIQRVHENAQKLEAFQKAAPENQPDAQ